MSYILHVLLTFKLSSTIGSEPW